MYQNQVESFRGNIFSTLEITMTQLKNLKFASGTNIPENLRNDLTGGYVVCDEIARMYRKNKDQALTNKAKDTLTQWVIRFAMANQGSHLYRTKLNCLTSGSPSATSHQRYVEAFRNAMDSTNRVSILSYSPDTIRAQLENLKHASGTQITKENFEGFIQAFHECNGIIYTMQLCVATTVDEEKLEKNLTKFAKANKGSYLYPRSKLTGSTEGSSNAP